MLKTDLLYRNARYSVDSGAEQLIDLIQLICKNGVLWRRTIDGSEVRCASDDIAALIAADPSLNEVLADKLTRITAGSEALQELPLLLRMPGHGSDVTESLWSGAMRSAHLDDSCCVERETYRVLFVNETRLGAFCTSDVERLLLEPDAVAPPAEGYDCSQPLLPSRWATLTVEGGGPMT